MKKSFKALSLLLSVILILGTVSVAAAAAPQDYTPSIVVPGVFQSEVFYYENGEIVCNEEGEPLATPFFLSDTKEIVADALINALIPISSLLINQKDKDNMAANALADVLGRTVMEKQRLDKTGHFVNDIRATKYYDSVKDLSEHDKEYIYDAVPLQEYASIAGEENLYFFSYASFGNMIDTATELYRFIQFVKKDSGSDKVNIVPISQGGSIFNALMQIYADNGRSPAEDIKRIVYIVPALDGSLLIGEIYQNGLIDDDEELYSKMFPALMGDDDFTAYLINVVLRIIPNADLNNILDTAVKSLMNEYMRYSTLMWGLCPSGNYPACREMYLTDEDTTEIVKQTDWFYNAQLNRFDNILKAKADGVEIFDIVDYNVPLYEIVDSYDDVNADGIIQLDSTSMGAYSLGVNIELPEGYETPAELNHCTDPEHHNHKDPNYIVDPCTGLLPETTFYFFNQNHERTASNDIIMKLASALMTDDNFTSVFSYPERFPQFNIYRNSKGLMRDLERDKTRINVDALSPELKARYLEAVEIATKALDNTTMSYDDFEAAKAQYDEAVYACQRYLAGLPEEEEKPAAGFNFEAILLKIFKFLSDLLFNLFGGSGFKAMSK